VRVLDCDGFGSFEDIVDAMNWIATNALVRTTWALITWCVFAIYLHFRITRILSSPALLHALHTFSTERIVRGVLVQGPSVVVMSLAGDASTTVDAAVNKLVDAGIPVRFTPAGANATPWLVGHHPPVSDTVCCGQVVVAAGNDGISSCEVSPARAANTITVGATDSFDEAPSWSNYGACVTMHAPGTRAPHAARFPQDLGGFRRPGCSG
jgi:hypothetical protein